MSTVAALVSAATVSVAPQTIAAPSVRPPAQHLSAKRPAVVQKADCTIVPSTAAKAKPLTRGRLGATRQSGPGAEAEEEFFGPFLKQLLEAGADDAITGGAGWVLNLILGGDANSGADTAQLEQMISDESQQLIGIETSINNLANQLTNAEYAIQAQLAHSTYDEEVAAENSNISDIQGYSQAVCNLGNEALTHTHAHPYVPDSGDIGTINNIRVNATTALDNMSNALTGNGTGAKGIIATFRDSFWATQNAASGSTASEAIWTGAYLQSMHALLDYYVGLAVSLCNSYTEAIHWESTNPPLARANSDKIPTFYTQLRKDLVAWIDEATNNLPAIPTSQAVDIRSGKPAQSPTATYNRWTIKPVVLPGTNAEQYCVHAGQTCLFNQWDPGTSDATTVGGRLVPAVAPVSAYLAAGTGGYAGWHLPTGDDWSGLIAATHDSSHALSGLDPNVTGVAAWGNAEQIPILENQNLASPDGKTVHTIAPVDVASADHSVVTYNDPTSAGATAPVPPTGVQYAGNLGLETTIQATLPDLPPEPVAAAPLAPARRAAPPALTARPGTKPVHVVHPKLPARLHRLRGSVDQTTRFTSASTCASNAFTQPDGANAVKVVVQGGHGGSGGGSVVDAGGVGGVVTATIPLAAGTTVYAQVGGAGGDGTEASNEGQPGAGGSGGGAAGGQDAIVNTAHLGGGGGGASGISADPNCHQWLTLAGGGGGGGGTYGSGTEGYAGGNGCPNTSCKAKTPTTDNGGSLRDQGAGDGGAIVTGGSGGTCCGHGSTGKGDDGTRLAGGKGGTGAMASCFCYSSGGSGGGGGGGWGGGGGGGGSFEDFSGAGGAGGGSYVVPGVAQRSFATASGGGTGSVTITPVVAPEYTIGTFTAANLPPTGYMLTMPAGSGATLTRTPRTSNTNQQWALLRVGDDGSNQYYILKSSTGACVLGPTSGNEKSGPVTSVDCGDLSAPTKAWTFIPQAADVWTAGTTTTTYWNYQMYTFTDSGISAQANLAANAPVSLASPDPVTLATAGQRWGLQIDPAFSIWALPSDKGGLSAPSLTGPPPPARHPSRTRVSAPELANTGTQVLRTILLGLALVAFGAILTTMTRPGRRRTIRRRA